MHFCIAVKQTDVSMKQTDTSAATATASGSVCN